MPLIFPYCTVADVQSEIQNTDPDDALSLIGPINDTSRWIDWYCRRDFLFHDNTVTPLVVPQSWCAEDTIYLPWPALTLNSITVNTDGTLVTLDPALYRLEPSYLSASSKIFGTGRWLRKDVYSRTGLLPHRLFPLQTQISLYGTFGYTNSGVQQIETATAVGTIGTSGNATVVVTGAGIVGSPLTLTVAVLSGDTPTVWAAKVAAALAANAAVSAIYVATSVGTQVILTAILGAVNDGTLNVSLANGTCTGITPAPTSVTSKAGSLLNSTTPADTIPPEVRRASTVFAAIRSGKARKDIVDFGGNRQTITQTKIPKDISDTISRFRVPLV